jgi:hypothetical protein
MVELVSLYCANCFKLYRADRRIEAVRVTLKAWREDSKQRSDVAETDVEACGERGREVDANLSRFMEKRLYP